MLGEEGPDLGGGGVRVCFGPEGDEAGDVGCGHAGAREAGAALGHGEGGEDVDAGSDEVDLASPGIEAAVGEIAELELRVDGADGEDGGAVGRVADGGVGVEEVGVWSTLYALRGKESGESESDGKEVFRVDSGLPEDGAQRSFRQVARMIRYRRVSV